MRPLRGLLCCLLLAGSGCGSPAPPPPGSPSAGSEPGRGGARPVAAAVVVISLDGVGASLVDRTATPHLDALASSGCSARRMVPPFPSLTFPAHATLATGRSANAHGIVSNHFRDRESGRDFSLEDESSWLLAEPLWVTAARQGVSTHVLHWPLSEGPWNGVRPDSVLPYQSRLSVSGKVDRILQTLREGPRPLLLLSYWGAADRAGHEHGPDAAETREALRGADRALGRLAEGMSRLPDGPRLALVVVSDHGMLAVDRAVDLVAAKKRSRLRAWIEFSGPIANVYLDPGTGAAAARRTLEAGGGVRCRELPELPARYGYGPPARAGEVVCEAGAGLTFERIRPGESDGAGVRGMHGYDPGMEEMGAILVAAGPGLAAGCRIGRAEAVDLHPLVAALLGIRPAEGVEGKVPFPLQEGPDGP